MEPVSRPEWLKIRYRPDENYEYVENLLDTYALHTVCQEANCPNRMECYSRKTATFMILGSVCTRNCTFCNVTPGTAPPADPKEPYHLARAVKDLRLEHVVITSVTRDDIPDGGSSHFARVVEEVQRHCRDVVIEVLIPDFGGDEEALRKVVDSGPHIINHNMETVPRLYPDLRPQAVYGRSLELLGRVKQYNPDLNTKSGIMVGVGETESEVVRVMEDLRRVDCDYLTIGQYMAPSKKHYPVVEWVTPDQFEVYRHKALTAGFRGVASSPLVRSSYQAAELYEK